MHKLSFQNGLLTKRCDTCYLSYSSIPLSIYLCSYREMTILTYFKLSKGIFLNFNVGKASWWLVLWLNVVQLLTAASVRKAEDDCITVTFCHILVAKLLQGWWQWTKQEWQRESKLWFWIKRVDTWIAFCSCHSVLLVGFMEWCLLPILKSFVLWDFHMILALSKAPKTVNKPRAGHSINRKIAVIVECTWRRRETQGHDAHSNCLESSLHL